MRTIRRLTALALCFAAALAISPALAQSAVAQNWPQRTVRLIVPLPPGTGTDLAARLLAERLTERWGQPVIVEIARAPTAFPR